MKYVAVDIETIGLKPFGGTIWIISVFDGKKTQIVSAPFGVRVLPAWLKTLLEDKKTCKVIHNAEFDAPYIELVTGTKIRNIWDTRVAEAVVLGQDGSRGAGVSTSLKETLTRYGFPTLNKSIVKQFVDRPLGSAFTKEELKYASDDVAYLLDLRVAQEKIATRDGLLEVVLLENELVEVLAGMKVRGIGFDAKHWLALFKVNEAEYAGQMAALPRDINWGSPAQVKTWFKVNRGITIESLTDIEEVARGLAAPDPFLTAFIRARSIFKAVTAYGDNWIAFIDGDKRIRGSYTQVLATGRMSMSHPNLQQIPKRSPHRKAFVPAKGKVLVIGDFSNQEIGIMAAASDEKIWIDALLRGDDVHSLVASLLFSESWKKGSAKTCGFPKKCSCPGHVPLRDQAKVLNFMLAYGGGPQRFAAQTGVDKRTAQMIVQKYKRVVPKLTAWLANNARLTARTRESFSADFYKRRRVVNEPETWQRENIGKNNPIQGAGANMTKLAMISMPAKFPLVLTLHDELVLEVPTSQGKEAAKAMKEVMEQAADRITGIKGLVKVKPRIAKSFETV